ncbi:MAG: universal stress protein [Salinigranum sp.]
MYDRVLLATDGGPGTDEAVRQALSIAARYGASLDVLYVATAGSLPLDAHSQTVLAEFENAGRESLDEVVDLARERGLDARGVVERGVPHRMILSHADANDCDVVVMSKHGEAGLRALRAGIRRPVLGSVTARVLRSSDVPVLVVPPRRRPSADAPTSRADGNVTGPDI